MAELIGGSGYDDVQDTKPSSPSIGDTWLDTSNDPPVGKVYADLGSGGQWTIEAGVDSSTTASIVSRINGNIRSAFGRLFFDRGMDELGFSDGFYSIYQDVSDITTTNMNAPGDGSVTPTSDTGTLEFEPYDVGFIPSRVVITHSSTSRSRPIANDNQSISYTIQPYQQVSDASLIFRGEDNTSDDTVGVTNVSIGESPSRTIKGNTPTDVDVEISGDGSKGVEFFSQEESDVLSIYANIGENHIGVGKRETVNIIDLSTGSNIESYYDNRGWGGVTGYGDNYYFHEYGGELRKLGTNGDTWSRTLDGELGEYATVSTNTNDPYIGILAAGNGPTFQLFRDDGTSSTKMGETGGNLTEGYDIYYHSSTDTFGFTSGVDIYFYNLSGNEVASKSYTDGANVSGNERYVGRSSSGIFYVIDSQDGSEVYSRSVPASARIAPGETTDYLYANNSYVYREDSNGNEVWRTYTSFSYVTELFTSQDEKYIIALSQDGDYRYLDPSDGEQLATINTSTDYSIEDFPDNRAFAEDGSPVTIKGWKAQATVVDPTVEIDGKSVSFSGKIFPTDSPQKTINNVDSGNQNINLSGSSGKAHIQLHYTAKTRSENPSVTISSDSGSQTISHTGILSQDEKVDLTSELDTSLISGDVTVSATISDSVPGPTGKCVIDYTHSGFDAGGIINYYVVDEDGNRSGRIPVDSIADVPSLTSSKLQVEVEFIRGWTGVQSDTLSVYFDN